MRGTLFTNEMFYTSRIIQNYMTVYKIYPVNFQFKKKVNVASCEEKIT